MDLVGFRFSFFVWSRGREGKGKRGGRGSPSMFFCGNLFVGGQSTCACWGEDDQCVQTI
jgi:hypothetical protein